MVDEHPTPTRFQRWSERANPVLIKEVRSALRGRTFMIAFVILLMLALVVSTIAMVATTSDEGIPSGNGYLGAVTVVFMLGTMLLVPFMAMAAMGAEHEDSALEMLQLSGLSPGRVVLGKLAGAAVQAILIYSACLPFLAFAFLLPGTDLISLLGLLVTMLAWCLAYSSVGILLGATLRARRARVFGYVFLAIVIFMGFTIPSIFMARFIGAGAGVAWVWTLLLPLAISGLVIALCCVHATSRLQHAEENRSTPYRIVGTVALLVACGFGLASDSPDELFVWLLVAIGLGTPALIMGVTEKERLPRAVQLRAQRRPWPWYAIPWMPGGGFAVLLLLVHFGLVLAAAFVAGWIFGTQDAWRTVGALALVEAWLLVVLLLPAGVFARHLDRPWVQGLARVATLVMPVFFVILPTIAMFVGGHTAGSFGHVGNPAHLPVTFLETGEVRDVSGFVILLVGVCVALALNVPRVVRSLHGLARGRDSRPEGRPGHAAPQP